MWRNKLVLWALVKILISFSQTLSIKLERPWNVFISVYFKSSDNWEITFLFMFLNIFIYLFLERGREGKREGEKHQCLVASHMAPTGDLAHNPGMCPDWESNQRPFGSQTSAQSTEPHQPGPISLSHIFILYLFFLLHSTSLFFFLLLF